MTDALRSIATPALTPAFAAEQSDLVPFRGPASAQRRSTSTQPVHFYFEALESRALLSANVAPTFTMPSGPISVTEDAALQTYSQWATDISAGSPDEASQQLYFTVAVDDETLFSVAPTVTVDGTMSFAPAPNAFGTAHVTVLLHDYGGTGDGGSNTSIPHTFDITIDPTVDNPTIGSLQASGFVATGPGIKGTGFSFTLTAISVKDVDGPVANVRFYEDSNSNGLFDVLDTLVALGHRSGDDWSAAISRQGFEPSRYFVQASDEFGYNSNVPTTVIDFNPVSISKVTGALTLRTGKAFKLTAVNVVGASAVEFYHDTNHNGIIDAEDDLIGLGKHIGKNWQLTAMTPVVPILLDARGKKIPTPVTLLVRGVNADGDFGVTRGIQTKVV